MIACGEDARHPRNAACPLAVSASPPATDSAVRTSRFSLLIVKLGGKTSPHGLPHFVPPGLRLKSSGCFQLPILMWKTAVAIQALAAFIRDFIGLVTAAFHPAQTR